MTRHPQLDLQAILPLVRKPGQYIGGELHAESGRMIVDHGYAASTPPLPQG